MPSKTILCKFPKSNKFIKLTRKKYREKLDVIHTILYNCSTVAQFKSELGRKLTNRTRRKIEYLTRDQADCDDWYYFRKSLITGTLTKRVCSVINGGTASIDSINKAISKTHCTDLQFPAIVFGRTHEETARQEFWSLFQKNHKNPVIKRLGLILHPEHPILGGSVDFTFACSCCNKQQFILGEIKCSYKLRDRSVRENFTELNYLDELGHLKPAHQYNFQIQTYLGLLGLQKAVLIVWSPVDFLSIDVNFDEELWREISINCHKYYFQHYVPSILGHY